MPNAKQISLGSTEQKTKTTKKQQNEQLAPALCLCRIMRNKTLAIIGDSCSTEGITIARTMRWSMTCADSL
eukprot:scaffold4201_cov178-Amphora_coffeaeformis.AAC.16